MKKNGFTLIELLVVVAIIGILAVAERLMLQYALKKIVRIALIDLKQI